MPKDSQRNRPVLDGPVHITGVDDGGRPPGNQRLGVHSQSGVAGVVRGSILLEQTISGWNLPPSLRLDSIQARTKHGDLTYAVSRGETAAWASCRPARDCGIMQMSGIEIRPNPFRNGIKRDSVFDLASQSLTWEGLQPV